MANLRAAVIGLGIGKQHVRVLAGMHGVDLVAIADLNGALLETIAREHRGEFKYVSEHELFE